MFRLIFALHAEARKGISTAADETRREIDVSQTSISTIQKKISELGCHDTVAASAVWLFATRVTHDSG